MDGPVEENTIAEQDDTVNENKETESKAVTTDNVEVNITLDPSTTSTAKFNIECQIEEIQQHLLQTWSLPGGSSVTLSYNGELLSATTKLVELGVASEGRLELQAAVENYAPTGDDLPHPPPNTSGLHNNVRCASLVSVEVDDGSGEGIREVLVRVERSSVPKPFLGGYRHRRTGVEYHHAAAQTLPKKRPDIGVEKFQRDTQTFLAVNKCQQVMFDATTQMTKTGCHISEFSDKIIVPGRYETAEEYHQKRLDKVMVLQRHWRRWLAQRFVSSLREERQKQLQWEEQEALRRQEEREQRMKREFERRMNPKTKEDFDLLYHTLELWRQDELRLINETTSGAARKAALCGLLEQEAQLIASVGRHKIVADTENKVKRAHQFLDATAAPKHWIAFDGEMTQMDTPDTIRAQQLRNIYLSISRENLTPDERLDVLLTLKQTVKQHNCRLTRDIVELIDREAQLIVKEFSDPALEGLRKRICTLFLQYCKTPLFNPEAAKHVRVPPDPYMLRSNIYYCRSCCKYLPSTDFSLPTNSRVVGHCRSCEQLDNKARLRADYSVYRQLLKEIKQSEEHYKDESQIIFLLQVTDLCYLVEQIWLGQSLLSSKSDLAELTLIRWDANEHWSPWNCILLTEEEAMGHLALTSDPEASYAPVIVQKVKHRHVIARQYFAKLPNMIDQLDDKVMALPLPRPAEKVMTSRDTATVAHVPAADPVNTS